MHQPNYREPHSDRLSMPWVRLHALKDYLDMPLTAGERENVRVTFNLVPSLLDQLESYLDGGTDRHLELSRAGVEELPAHSRLELLESFFSANPSQMIEPYPRYRALYKKFKSGANDRETLVSLFSSAEIRDLQVWSNLTWVDPRFRTEEPVAALLAKGRHFEEDEKQALLDWQLELIGRIVPTYKKLQEDNRIEVSFTPYYHPILPLLCDTNSATEALPSIRLPRRRFSHPEDAERQVVMAIERYRDVFGRELKGMWPSEGSVSEEVLDLLISQGIKWAASDEEILSHSLTKSNLAPRDHPIHRVYDYGPGLKLFFRDHALSDRIGFVYSTWKAHRAVRDFIEHLKRIRSMYLGRLDDIVVPIILDGENAWEYFPDDGTEFLDAFYQALDEDEEIETVTMSEAAEGIEATRLPSVFAGSWINHNFRIWIGHEEDNSAWDRLKEARDTLSRFERENPDFDPGRLKAAWNQIYIAEGSDWCWWYGDEHRSEHNQQFDQIYRQHLTAVYELLGLEIPLDLMRPIAGGGLATETIMPDSLVTPQLDGRITQYYEWAGAGLYDCRKAGGAMHLMQRHVEEIYLAFDHDRFHIRLDFQSKKELDLIDGLKAVVTLFTPESKTLELSLGPEIDEGGSPGEYRFAYGDILELSIERTFLWSKGSGTLSFTVGLYQGDQKLESWPDQEPIQLDVPRQDQEIFWPS
ncbi:MAG: glycoside hydrolase [bacterium]|nr:glycoside hydrolase [bacterium]